MKDTADTLTTDLPLGEQPTPRAGRGRPRQHADKAAKQRAYRQRLKAKGKRVITAVVADVRDDSKPLESAIIDLSEVRQW